MRKALLNSSTGGALTWQMSRQILAIVVLGNQITAGTIDKK
jgi:hypothetical protein